MDPRFHEIEGTKISEKSDKKKKEKENGHHILLVHFSLQNYPTTHTQKLENLLSKGGGGALFKRGAKMHTLGSKWGAQARNPPPPICHWISKWKSWKRDRTWEGGGELLTCKEYKTQQLFLPFLPKFITHIFRRRQLLQQSLETIIYIYILKDN